MLASCENFYIDQNLGGSDYNPTDVRTVDYTLTDADYKNIVTNKNNIEIAKAACVAEEPESELETEQFTVEQLWELWLLEDMTFVTILNTRVFVKTNGEVSGVVESRAYVNNVEGLDTLPVGPESLICHMDDDCMFEQILSDREARSSEGQAE